MHASTTLPAMRSTLATGVIQIRDRAGVHGLHLLRAGVHNANTSLHGQLDNESKRIYTRISQAPTVECGHVKVLAAWL